MTESTTKVLSLLAKREVLRDALDSKATLLTLLEKSGTVVIPALCELPPKRFVTAEHFQCATCGKVFAQDEEGAQFHVTLALGDGTTLSLMAFFCNGSEQCKQALSADLQAYIKSTTVIGTDAATVCADLESKRLPQLSDRRCESCGEKSNLMRCRGCLSVRYCSLSCQRSNWSAHKQQCKTAQNLLRREACEID